MTLFGSIRRFNDGVHVRSMRALRVLQPFMFVTAAGFHVCMLWLTAASRIASPVHLAVRCALLGLCVLGLVAALRAHGVVRRGATPVARIQAFLVVLALSVVAIATYLAMLWEILQLAATA